MRDGKPRNNNPIFIVGVLRQRAEIRGSYSYFLPLGNRECDVGLNI